MKNYTAYCINCGSDKCLRMMPHRNTEGQMVGWIFVCDNCESYIADKSLLLMLEDSVFRWTVMGDSYV